MYPNSLAELDWLFKRFPKETVSISQGESIESVQASEALGPWLRRFVDCCGIEFDETGCTVGMPFNGPAVRIAYSAEMVRSFDASPSIDEAIRIAPDAVPEIVLPLGTGGDTDHQLIVEDIADTLATKHHCTLTDIAETLGQSRTLQILHDLADQRQLSLLYSGSTVLVSLNRNGWIRAYRGLMHRCHDSITWEPATDPLCLA